MAEMSILLIVIVSFFGAMAPGVRGVCHFEGDVALCKEIPRSSDGNQGEKICNNLGLI